MLIRAMTVSAVMLIAAVANAQQVKIETPLISVNESFYEDFRVDWGYRSRNGNFFFNRGSSASAIPPFGNFNPNAGAQFGFARRGRNGDFFMNFNMGQGTQRSITMEAPSVVIPNGGFGSIQDVSVRPFVTGIVPVVNDGFMLRPMPSPIVERLERLRRQEEANKVETVVPSDVAAPSEVAVAPKIAAPKIAAPKDAAPKIAAPADAKASSPLRLGGPPPKPAASAGGGGSSRQQSSAERGAASVFEIRQAQARVAASRPKRTDEDEVALLIETARLAEIEGRFGAARIRYQKAAARATGALKEQLTAKLETLKDK